MAAKWCLLLALLVAGAASEPQGEAPRDVALTNVPGTADAPAPAGPIPKFGDILKSIKTALDTQLKKPGFQWLNAACALAIGIVMLISGEFVFKYIVVGFFSLFVFLLSMSMLDSNHGDFPGYVRYALSTEVALFTGSICYLGYEGIQLLIGGLVGFVLYENVHHQFAEHVSEPTADKWIFFVVGVNLCAIIGITFFWVGKFHTRAMAFISSIMGGLFVASSVGFFIMVVARKQRESLNANYQLNINDDPVNFIDFLWTAVGWGKETSVGVFQHIHVDFPVAGNISVDKVLGRTLWAVTALIGWMVQRRAEKKGKKAQRLDEPLLPSNHP